MKVNVTAKVLKRYWGIGFDLVFPKYQRGFDIVIQVLCFNITIEVTI